MNLHQINESNALQSIDKIDIDSFYLNKMNYVSIEKILNSIELRKLVDELKEAEQRFNEAVLNLPDGYFFPYPYSTIHEELNEENKLFVSYFNHAQLVNQNLNLEGHGLLSQFIDKLMNEIFHVKVRPLHYANEKFAAFGVRNLFAQKNGIDIHCENAFLNQLSTEFKEWIETKVDLENSLSFFMILQKPDQGGELVLFDKFWNDFQLSLCNTSYEERHHLEGSLFLNRGVSSVNLKKIDVNEGCGIVFPAAQRWHAINKIDGQKNRISLGCFIGKGYDGNFYYWA